MEGCRHYNVIHALDEMLDELKDDEFAQVEDFIINYCGHDGEESNFFRLLLLRG